MYVFLHIMETFFNNYLHRVVITDIAQLEATNDWNLKYLSPTSRLAAMRLRNKIVRATNFPRNDMLYGTEVILTCYQHAIKYYSGEIKCLRSKTDGSGQKAPITSTIEEYINFTIGLP